MKLTTIIIDPLTRKRTNLDGRYPNGPSVEQTTKPPTYPFLDITISKSAAKRSPYLVAQAVTARFA